MKNLSLRWLWCFVALLLGLAGLTTCVWASPARLTLPPVIYAVPGVEMSLYFSNAVLAATNEALSFSENCAVGKGDSRRWKLNTTAKQMGVSICSRRLWLQEKKSFLR